MQHRDDLVREVYQVTPLNMRHAPDKHGEHAHEQAHADCEVGLSVVDAAARAEVLLPSIVVGR